MRKARQHLHRSATGLVLLAAAILGGCAPTAPPNRDKGMVRLSQLGVGDDGTLPPAGRVQSSGQEQPKPAAKPQPSTARPGMIESVMNYDSAGAGDMNNLKQRQKQRLDAIGGRK